MMKGAYCKLNVLGFALAIGVVWGLGLFFTGITAFQGHLSNLEALERQQAVRDETINSNRAINNRKQKG